MNSGFSMDAKVRIEPWDQEGLERLIRYCSRPCFTGENLRWNGLWLMYRLPKPTHTGQTFVQLEPLDFLDRIAAFIPPPRRHRHHYHGVFAPNAPQRALIAASAGTTPKRPILPNVHETSSKITKVSLNWAKMIARIYEVNPLLCPCGKEMKIIAIVTHLSEIWRILSRVGWPTKAPDFDPPVDFADQEVSQLVAGTVDGFPAMDYSEEGPDPPLSAFPQWENDAYPPHWEESNYVIYD